MRKNIAFQSSVSHSFLQTIKYSENILHRIDPGKLFENFGAIFNKRKWRK